MNTVKTTFNCEFGDIIVIDIPQDANDVKDRFNNKSDIFTKVIKLPIDIYDVVVNKFDYGNNNVRNQSIIMSKQNYNYKNDNKDILTTLDVDGGSCFIFDRLVIQYNDELNRYLKLDNICKGPDPNIFTVNNMNLGIYCQSGFGDGIYNVYSYRNNGEITAIEVNFL